MVSAADAFASAACDAVNSGGFNQNQLVPGGSGVIDTIANFEVGDTVTFTVSGLPGSSFELINGALNTALLIQPLSASQATLSYTVTGSNSDTTLNTYMLVQAIPYEITITATCLGVPAPSGMESRIVKGFLQARINGILLNSPGSTSLLNRQQGSGGQVIASAPTDNTSVASNNAAAFGSAMGLGAGPGAVGGRGASRLDDADASAAGTQNIAFRNSLSQMRRDAGARRLQQDRMALGAGDGGALPIVYETYTPWDLWVEGRFSAFDDDAGNLDRNGHVGVLYVGGDYRVAQNMIVGALVQVDWAKDDSGLLQSKVDGTGWMVGPYLSMQVHDNIYFDLRAAWGRSSNDIDVVAASGSFDTSRWLVKGTLAGNWLYDAWRITPSAELAYVEERADAFTTSGGSFVPGQTASLGRLQFGPEIGYRFQHTSDSFLEPFGAIRGVWDFDNPNVAIIDGFVVGPGDFWGRLEGGLNWVRADGLYVRGSATWDGMGASDYNGYTLQGTVNVPLN
jgi:outer membrane autotransporter protein